MSQSTAWFEVVIQPPNQWRSNAEIWPPIVIRCEGLDAQIAEGGATFTIYLCDGNTFEPIHTRGALRGTQQCPVRYLGGYFYAAFPDLYVRTEQKYVFFLQLHYFDSEQRCMTVLYEQYTAPIHVFNIQYRIEIMDLDNPERQLLDDLREANPDWNIPQHPTSPTV